MGFPTELVAWLKSFLTDRHVKLKFNGFISNSYDLKVGTPKGTPFPPSFPSYLPLLSSTLPAAGRTQASPCTLTTAIFSRAAPTLLKSPHVSAWPTANAGIGSTNPGSPSSQTKRK